MAQTIQIVQRGFLRGFLRQLVEWLAPFKGRRYMLQTEKFFTPYGFVRFFLPSLGKTLALGAWYDLGFVLSQGVFLFIAYSAGPRGPVLFMVSMALLSTIVRDAYMDPSKRTPGEAVHHGLFTLACIGVCAYGLYLLEPSWFYREFYFGASLNIILMSGLRLIFNAEQHPENLDTFKDRFKSTKQLWVLWCAAIFGLMLLCAEADPDDTGRDFIAGLFFSNGVLWSFALRKIGMSRHIDPYNLGEDTQRAFLAARHMISRGCGLGAIAFEIVVFIGAWMVPFDAARHWLTHAPEAARTDWYQMWINIGGLFTVTILWFMLKRLSIRTAECVEVKNEPPDREQQTDDGPGDVD